MALNDCKKLSWAASKSFIWDTSHITLSTKTLDFHSKFFNNNALSSCKFKHYWSMKDERGDVNEKWWNNQQYEVARLSEHLQINSPFQYEDQGLESCICSLMFHFKYKFMWVDGLEAFPKLVAVI